jgi:hypothetical protein
MSSSALLATSSALAPPPPPPPLLGGAAGLAVVGLDCLDDRRFRRDHRFDVVARHELDVVHGEDVGRIGHRDRQRGAGARERDDLILLRGLRRHELDDAGVDLKLSEGDGRNAVLLAEERGDLLVFHISELDQIEAELPPILALIVQRLLKLLWCDALLLEEKLSDPDCHRMLERPLLESAKVRVKTTHAR